jgi:hypothetical protein
MSDVFVQLLGRPGLLRALINQSQAVRHIGVTEWETGEVLSLVGEALVPALYQAGGLLNEHTLEAFFAEPLPDVLLAAACKSQTDTELSPPKTERPLLPKQRTHNGEEILNYSAPAKVKTRRQKPQKKEQRESKPTEMEHAVATGQKSGNNQEHLSRITQTVQQKVTVLQESKKRADSRSEQQQFSAVTPFADKARRAGKKSRSPGQVHASPASQAQLKAEPKNPAVSIDSQAINCRQAANILEKKWMHQAWNSPINTSGNSAQIGLLRDDKNQTRSRHSESPLRVTEKRLEQKIAQLLDKKSDAGERREPLGTALVCKPQRENYLTPDTNEAPQQKTLTDLGSEQANAHAFTPAPSTSTKPERLVGLRGLAARAATNEYAAPAAASNQGRTAVDQAPVSAQGQAPVSAVSQTSAREPTINTTRAMSVSELAELIAQEAKRAGINLEQFQP